MYTHVAAAGSVLPIMENPIEVAVESFVRAVKSGNSALAEIIVKPFHLLEKETASLAYIEEDTRRFIELLQQQEIDPIVRDCFLTEAISRGCDKAALALLRAMPNEDMDFYGNILKEAISQRRLEVVQYICAAHPDAVKYKGWSGSVALHEAVMYKGDRPLESETIFKIVSLVVRAWPEGIVETNRKGEAPLSSNRAGYYSLDTIGERNRRALFCLGLNANHPSSLRRFAQHPLFDRNVIIIVGDFGDFLTMDRSVRQLSARIGSMFIDIVMPQYAEAFIDAVKKWQFNRLIDKRQWEKIGNELSWLKTSQKERLLEEYLKPQKQELGLDRYTEDGWNLLHQTITPSDHSTYPYFESDMPMIIANLEPKLIMSRIQDKCLGLSGMDLAIKEQRLELVKHFLSLILPADLLNQNFFKQTPLHIAALSGGILCANTARKCSLEIAKAIMEACPRALEIRDRNGQLPEEVAQNAAQGLEDCPEDREIYQRIAALLSEGRRELQRKLAFAIALITAKDNPDSTSLKDFANSLDCNARVLKAISEFMSA